MKNEDYSKKPVSIAELGSAALAIAWFAGLGVLVAALLAGCMRSISLERTGDGYDFSYRNIGLRTDVERIEVERSTNGYIHVVIAGVTTDISTNSADVIESGGGAIGAVVGNAVSSAIK